MFVLSVMLFVAFAILLTIAIAEIRDVHCGANEGAKIAASLTDRAARLGGR
jgi:hypothetical protein